MLVSITDNPNLVRDTTNRAILNIDRDGLERYKAQRQVLKQRMEEQQEVKNKVEKLEEDITEIKSLLHELLQMRTANGN